MIEPVKFGKLRPVNFFIRFKDIKMRFILWRLIFLMGTLYFLSSDKVATGSFDKTAKLWDC